MVREKLIFLDHTKLIDERVKDIVSRLTLEEKISQILHNSPAIERLNIPKYNWWNECLHGVARAGIATVFPQAIGLAATWNPDLIHKVGSAISDEARAKYNDAINKDFREWYYGLTFWAPNINIFRDPRWGRGQETYGEDPFLTSKIAIAFIKGLQGDHSKYLKVAACAKHYAVHSGPEKDRHSIDVNINRKDLFETYLFSFKSCVQEAKVESVMCAYNRINGEAACASETLLKKILREEWNFKGHIVSDCGAINDIWETHKIARNFSEAAAKAINAGCDLFCVTAHTNIKLKKIQNSIINAVNQNLLSEEQIDQALRRLFSTRMKLGMFDPPELVPYTNIKMDVVDCQKHRNLALQIARESIVLLKNDKNLLPLKKEIKSIAIIGPNVNDIRSLRGNYYGDTSKYITLLEGLKNKILAETELFYSQGCELTKNNYNGFSEALNVAEKSELIIMGLGLSNLIEGEQVEVADPTSQGDRLYVDLPIVQEELLKRINSLGKPLVLVLFSGSALSINFASENVPAILHAWYPGEEGGNAIADVIFGDYNPAGRLPITFYKSLEQLPDFNNYDMEGRSYRFLREMPLYSFGYGQSYTRFKYSNLEISPKKFRTNENISISVKVKVKNIGEYDGDEVVQLYINNISSSRKLPIRSLQGFKRIHIKKEEEKKVEFSLTLIQFSRVDDNGKNILEAGMFSICVGGCQEGFNVFKENLIKDSIEIYGDSKEVK